jgi:hypothetical protein
VRHGLAPDACRKGGADLVEHLERAIAGDGQAPKLRIIEGSAGSGKTVAFNALVASLYRQFIDAKRARRECRRPIVFLPGHLRGKKIGYVDDVIAAVAQTDVAEVTALEQFKWLLQNGHALWMFDGLDEFYDGRSDFFSFIDQALSAPDSNAQFIICTRDSLLSSNKPLADFLERRLAKGSEVEVYDLAPWSRDAWRELAWLELQGTPPKGNDPERVRSFVSALEKSDDMAALAGLPFYCSVLLERFKKDDTLPKDEFDALDFLVDRMIDREHGKDIFRWRDYVDLDHLSRTLEEEILRRGLPVPAGLDARQLVGRLLDAEGRDILFELIGSIAHGQRRGSGGGEDSDGMLADDLRQLSGLSHVSINLNAEVVRRLQTVIVQFAFFGPGRKAGCVDFTHDITADYLAARYAVTVLSRELLGNGHDPDPQALRRAMQKAVGGREIVPHSLFCRSLAREIQRHERLDRLFRSPREPAPVSERGRAESVLSLNN